MTVGLLLGASAPVTTYRLSIRLDVRELTTEDHDTMPYFLVEIPMNEPGLIELQRAMRTLKASRARLERSATETHTLVAGLSPADGRLVCLIKAPGLETVRRVVTLALLPAGRIREVTHLTCRPGADQWAG